jgi:carbon storage regulator
MLVLSRKVNEAIVIPGLNLTIRVAEVSGQRVRLAFDAPRDVQIVRQEILPEMEVQRGAIRSELAESPTATRSQLLV